MGTSARRVALDCLVACEKQGAWSDGYLRRAIREAGLDSRDAGLCTQIAFGVQQNLLLLDWYLDQFSNTPVDKLESAIRADLRLGLYQLLFLDRVPAHAAVSESVSLAKACSRNPRAASLVNAVLRSAQRAKEGGLPRPERLSIRYSHPQWLVDEFSRLLPQGEVEALLKADNDPPDTCAQVNTCRFSTEEVLAALREEGIEARPHPWLSDCLLLQGTGDLERCGAFREGMLYIQDAAARLAVMAAGPREGMRVLDACAAPGGKSFAAAMAMADRGEIRSCDIHPRKSKLIQEGARRLGLNSITAGAMDAKVFARAFESQFDLVMADVPCSGLGIIRKKPDIRYKDPETLMGLPGIQTEILENVARYVRPGGVLLYATCTLLQRENEGVVEQFLAKEKRFTLESFELPGPIGTAPGMLTLWPHRHGTDGFFMAKLRRS